MSQFTTGNNCMYYHSKDPVARPLISTKIFPKDYTVPASSNVFIHVIYLVTLPCTLQVIKKCNIEEKNTANKHLNT